MGRAGKIFHRVQLIHPLQWTEIVYTYMQKLPSTFHNWFPCKHVTKVRMYAYLWLIIEAIWHYAFQILPLCCKVSCTVWHKSLMSKIFDKLIISFHRRNIKRKRIVGKTFNESLDHLSNLSDFQHQIFALYGTLLNLATVTCTCICMLWSLYLTII